MTLFFVLINHRRHEGRESAAVINDTRLRLRA
jgi:hypothetical protein